MEESRVLTAAEKKAEKDKLRQRPGKKDRKRLKVLLNPAKKAFKGWEDVPEPWMTSDCEEYLEWCHVSKMFPVSRHRNHIHSDKVNLRYCSNEAFKERCIEVYQYLYRRPDIIRNEVGKGICRMVYAEIALQKRVDWRSFKTTKSMHRPQEMDIPRGRLYPDRGILERRGRGGSVEVDDESEDDGPPAPLVDSSPSDSDSDGRRVPKVSRSQSAVKSREYRAKKRTRTTRNDHASSSAEVEAAHAEPSVPVVTQHGDARRADVLATVLGTSSTMQGPVEASAEPSEISALRAQFQQMRHQLETRSNDVECLLRETKEKSEIIVAQTSTIQQQADLIAQLRQEIGQHVLRQQHTLTLEDVQPMLNAGTTAAAAPTRTVVDVVQQEVDVHRHGQTAPTITELDEAQIMDVVNDVTSAIVEDVNEVELPTRVQRKPVHLPPPVNVTMYVDNPIVATQGTQDSLAFPSPPPALELAALHRANKLLRTRLGQLSESYYQWKVACVLTVDRSKQIVAEYKKIDNEYLTHNQRRDFGLTSWELIDNHFPDEMVKLPNSNLIDWSKYDWDYETATSCAPDKHKLWPSPAEFVTNGEICAICCNPFGPEGGWALGTCRHMFHPQCLLKGCIARRFCALCKAPFHKRLYELFGLTPYMPPSWEKNPENTPGEHMMHHWGNDLLWNWRVGRHDVYKSLISAELGWEHNPEEIQRVCEHLIRNGQNVQGRRNFFYQTLDGYWDSVNNKFQYGKHPQGLLWDLNGNVVEQLGEPMAMDLRMALQMEESEWKETWKKDAVDFLLEEHSPETRRTLDALRNSQMLRALIEEDGPAKRTRAKKKLELPGGTGSSGAGPSGFGGCSS